VCINKLVGAHRFVAVMVMLVTGHGRGGKGCHVIWEEEGSTSESLVSSESSPAVNSDQPEQSPS
jgi:hypothetical protein